MSVFSSDWVDMFWRKGLCLAPQDALLKSAQREPMFPHLHHPAHVRLLYFSRMKGLEDGKANKRSGNWGHLLLYLSRLSS